MANQTIPELLHHFFGSCRGMPRLNTLLRVTLMLNRMRHLRCPSEEPIRGAKEKKRSVGLVWVRLQLQTMEVTARSGFTTWHPHYVNGQGMRT